MSRKLYVKAKKFIVQVVKESGEPQNKQVIEYTSPNGMRVVVKEKS